MMITRTLRFFQDRLETLNDMLQEASRQPETSKITEPTSRTQLNNSMDTVYAIQANAAKRKKEKTSALKTQIDDLQRELQMERSRYNDIESKIFDRDIQETEYRKP